MIKKILGVTGLLALSGFSSVASAGLVEFSIDTLPSAMMYSLDENGQVVNELVDVEVQHFSEQFQFDQLLQFWSSGIITDMYGEDAYTYAMADFGPVSAPGSTPLTDSLLAYNLMSLPLTMTMSISTMVNFWDQADPSQTDFSNNSINFSVNFSGHESIEQSEDSFINNWFNYSRQYVIHLPGVNSAAEVFSYDPLSLLNALQSGESSTVVFYELGYTGSAVCDYSGTCTNHLYTGMHYNGFGSYQFADITDVPAPAGWLLFAIAGGFLLRRKSS